MNLKSRISSFYSGIKENRTEYAEEYNHDLPLPDLYSYTGMVKTFDRELGICLIEEISDVKKAVRTGKVWSISAGELGGFSPNRGDFVYFMKNGESIHGVLPMNLRELLKSPCPECGRRDYVPGKDALCPHCGYRFDSEISERGIIEHGRDDDSAYNCLAGTLADRFCPVCGRKAWRRGYRQSLYCRYCGYTYKSNLMYYVFIFLFICVGIYFSLRFG